MTIPNIRVGEGWDVHALVEGRPLVLGGVTIPHSHGLQGHSDADALCHAITDALLGAAALGDIGHHFPDTDERFRGADSIALLAEAHRRVVQAGWAVGNAGALFQTIDGGAKWVDQTLPCGKTCTKVIDLLKVRFTNQQEGWIVGERGMLYRTTDGGLTWSEGKSITPSSLFGLSFPDASHGWASGENGAIVHLQPSR